MSKESFYFSHDYHARDDRKLVSVIMEHGMEGLGVYWCLVEMLYEEGGFLPLEYERITFELRTEISVVQSIINNFDLFKKDEEKFWSNSVLERLNKRAEKSEKARQSINARWNKYKDNTNVLHPNDKRITIKERKGKERNIFCTEKADEEKEYLTNNNHITQNMFDRFWSIYPRKDGKGKALTEWLNICTRRSRKPPTWQEVSRAVRSQIRSERWQDPQFIPMPATWLHQSRWIDDPTQMTSFNKESEQYIEDKELPDKFKK